MAHWSERYVGLPYEEGTFDCAHLVEKVLLEQFGRELHLPKEHESHYRAQQRQIEAAKASYAEPAAAPREGDGVILVSRGHAEHLGVYCEVGGEPCVLHNSRRFGSVVCFRVRELGRHLLAVEGYYRWT